jgi:hypothetical protein
MSPLIRLVGRREEEKDPGLFIPFPRLRHDTAALEAALPELRAELSRQWPVKEVRIKRPSLTLPNPSYPDLVAELIPTAEGLIVLFLGTAAISGGRRFGKDVGKQMAVVVNKWLKRLEPRKQKPTRSRKGLRLTSSGGRE